MATGQIQLPPGVWYATDGSGSGNAPATWVNEVSSGTQTANTPKVTQGRWDFDGATDQHICANLGPLPQNWASALTLRGKVKFSNNTSANAIVKAGLAPTTDGSTADSALVFTAGDLSNPIAVPGTAGQTVEFTVSLTTTNLAIGRKVILFLGRDADHASDTASTATMQFLGADVEYTTT